jgi:TonB family protein
VRKIRQQPATSDHLRRNSLFSTELPSDEGPGARATVVSLAVHAAAVTAAALWIHFGLPVSFRPYEVSMLRETRLIDPLVFSAGPRANSGGGTGNRQGMPAPRGQTPPRAETHSVLPPLKITVPDPKLQVSSTLLDVPPPKIEQDFRYGDPASSLQSLAAGAGLAGIGAGQSASNGLGTASGGRSSSSAGPIYDLSAVSVPPVLLYKVDPEYTEQARLSRYNGIVLLRLVIDEQGTPRDIHVLRSLGLGLDERAVEAVRQWRFRPGLKDGRAVAVNANIELNFRLL